MKEKIERLTKGIFEYKLPKLLLSQEVLLLTVEKGREIKGSFKIWNEAGRRMKGVLYSSHRDFVIDDDKFIGEENTIRYHCCATYLEPETEISGSISIISDCGEAKLLFRILVEAPCCDTSIGKVKDLFQFTNLAKTNWEEASALFQTPEFRRVLYHYDRKSIPLYDNLRQSTSLNQALEEFLVSVHKKNPIQFSAAKTELTYEAGIYNFMDKLQLTLNGWGYEEILVQTDVPFLKPDQTKINSWDFVNHTYELGLIIETEKLVQGKHFGHIILETIHQKIVIPVTCHVIKQRKRDRTRKRLKLRWKLEENYLKFRTGQLNTAKYTSEAENLISLLSGRTDADVHDLASWKDPEFVKERKFCDLYRVHLLYSSGKVDQAVLAFAKIKCDREEDTVCFGIWLYLQALLTKEKTKIEEACETLRQLLEKEPSQSLIFWCLLYLDRQYEENIQRKYEAIRNFCIEEEVSKNISPILYFEAAHLVRQEPTLLKKLGVFELSILLFGVKWNYFGKEIALHFCFLAGKEKKFDPLCYYVLDRYFKRYKIKELLNVICTLLIRGHCREKKYLLKYCQGMQEQLKVAELPEYYLYAAEECEIKRLEPSVYLYYSNHSSMDERKRAYLYACLIRNRKDYEVQYKIYEKDMEKFAIRQLKEQKFSKNLAVIYEAFLMEQILDGILAQALTSILFRHEIICKNPNITSVCVVHKETKEELTVDFSKGSAFIDLFTQDAGIFLIDREGKRYAATIDYTVNKLLQLDHLATRCYELGISDRKLLLHLSEKIIFYQKFDENAITLRRNTATEECLTQEYRRDCILSLIYHYYDVYEGELLEEYLLKIDLHSASAFDRAKVIEYMIIRDLFETALKALDEFGYAGLDAKRLLKLCSRLIRTMNENREEVKILLELCSYVFQAGKYDEEVLGYLIQYFYGTTEEMLELWKASRNFEMDTTDLEERLLGQILFAENYNLDTCSVFFSYYQSGLNRKLIRAFLSYYAYRYLANGEKIIPELTEIMKKECSYEENEICVLALLKEASLKEQITDVEEKFIHCHLHEFERKEILLPFFREFKKYLQIPQQMYDKSYIEYWTNPDNEVILHYSFNGTSYLEEPMKNLCYGCFIKEFILFPDEKLQYYITETTNGKEFTTKNKTLSPEPEDSGEEDTKYRQLHLMIMAHELGDDTAVERLMESYIIADSMSLRIFQPIDMKH